jgi:hypothetical protein
MNPFHSGPPKLDFNLLRTFAKPSAVRIPTANDCLVTKLNPQVMSEVELRRLAKLVARNDQVFLNEVLPISSGRSLYFVPNSSEFHFSLDGIDACKIKGARLCRRSQNTIKVERPNPLKRYGEFAYRPDHLKIHPDLKAERIPHAASYLGSIDYPHAEREFKIANRLASHAKQIAFPGLFCAKLKENSSVIKNAAGEETAMVALGFNSRVIELVEYLPWVIPFEAKAADAKVDKHTEVRDDANQCWIRHVEGAPIVGSIKELNDRMEATHNGVGDLKRSMYLDCLVARHVFHRGNALIDPVSQKIKLADFDSCVILNPDDRSTWGTQLLRDVFMDSVRVLLDGIHSTNINNSDYLRDAINICLVPFLKSFFKESDSSLLGRNFTHALLNDYLQSTEPFMGYKLDISKSATHTQTATAVAALSLSGELLRTLFKLIQQDSDFQDAGFRLPVLDDAILEKRFEAINLAVFNSYIGPRPRF